MCSWRTTRSSSWAMAWVSCCLQSRWPCSCAMACRPKVEKTEMVMTVCVLNVGRWEWAVVALLGALSQPRLKWCEFDGFFLRDSPAPRVGRDGHTSRKAGTWRSVYSRHKIQDPRIQGIFFAFLLHFLQHEQRVKESTSSWNSHVVRGEKSKPERSRNANKKRRCLLY